MNPLSRYDFGILAALPTASRWQAKKERRTFVEKLFAIHGKVELFKREGRLVGPCARHYYDLFELARQPEVRDMLRSDEYAAIKLTAQVDSVTPCGGVTVGRTFTERGPRVGGPASVAH